MENRIENLEGAAGQLFETIDKLTEIVLKLTTRVEEDGKLIAILKECVESLNKRI